MYKTSYIPKTDIKDLRVICDIYNSFTAFIPELERLYENHPKRDIAELLNRLSHGQEPLFTPKDIKEFAKRFQSELQVMNKYGTVENFLTRNFDNKNGTIKQFSPLGPYLTYLTAHGDELYRIRDIVKKIDDLGIKNIVLDDNENFSNIIYHLDINREWNPHFSYVHGIEIVPYYKSNIIKYQTEDSPYEIKLGGYDTGFIPKNDSTITVTSLVFDPALLPKKINASLIYNEVVRKSKEKKQTVEQFTNAVDLDSATLVLDLQLQSLEKIVESIQSQGPGMNIPMVNALSALREAALDLKTSSTAYQRQISKESDITPELIHSESKKRGKTYFRKIQKNKNN